MNKKISNKDKFKFLIVLLLLFGLTPFVVNYVVKTPSSFGFISKNEQDVWIGFYGSLIGGALTLLGVWWTTKDQEYQRRKDIMDADKPILIADVITYEKIKGIKGDKNSKVFECILNIKNVGKGILFNPRVLNIEYRIDNKEIGRLNPTFSVKSSMDVNETLENDLMIIFDLDDLDRIHDILIGRGNTLTLQIVVYIGGKDMYHRDIVTKLNYENTLSFFPDNEITLSLLGGKYTSIVINNENEITEILKNANPNYNVHI